MNLPASTERPRRRDYEKILAALETRWKRRPTERGKIMQEIVDALWETFGGKVMSWCGFFITGYESQELVLGPHRDQPSPADKIQAPCARAVAERQTQIEPAPAEGQKPTSPTKIAVPIFDKNGKLFAVFGVLAAPRTTFSDEDRRWLERLMRGLEQATTVVM